MTKKYLFNLLMVLGLVGFGVAFAQEVKEMPKAKPKTDSSGTYTRKSEKSSDNLQLTADKKAVWISRAEGKDDIVLNGTWAESEGNLTVTIPSQVEGGKNATVTFKILKDELEVAATAPDGLLPVGTKFLKNKA